MGLPVKKLDKKYTYGDYLTWPYEERWELIHGTAYNMSPAPLRIHQEILGILYLCFGNFFEDKECKVYLSPFDVRLPKEDEADENIDTVVQPDLSVICDKSKLDRKGCHGAPDLVVEIVSPGSTNHDMKIKLELYEQYSVKEYWIVLPRERIVEVYKLNAGGYGRPEVFSGGEIIKVALFPGLEIPLDKVFPPEEEESEKVREKRI